MSDMSYVYERYDVLFSWAGDGWLAQTIGKMNLVSTGATYEECLSKLRDSIHEAHAKAARKVQSLPNEPSSIEANKRWADAWTWDPRSIRTPDKTKYFRMTFEDQAWGKGVRLEAAK